ncbi:hypothetical protein HMPREF9261_0282 [Finegoldia magna ACS-171-V-Col3]|uniref:Uncharacterized protein n=1 Tax=Finegoldia magna BVS033A4 TaxID=866773 RepID=E1KXP3_FINMA|nr:hypothetical protein HMPREF9261_0282 [Finegoldia magna ACS-171-V-Col3]EFL54205.1 hypothetical protein HMPREF9289_0542 [Finegoldia magna BVS033A4]
MDNSSLFVICGVLSIDKGVYIIGTNCAVINIINFSQF